LPDVLEHSKAKKDGITTKKTKRWKERPLLVSCRSRNTQSRNYNLQPWRKRMDFGHKKCKQV